MTSRVVEFALFASQASEAVGSASGTVRLVPQRYVDQKRTVKASRWCSRLARRRALTALRCVTCRTPLWLENSSVAARSLGLLRRARDCPWQQASHSRCVSRC